MKNRLIFSYSLIVKALVSIGLAAIILPWLDAFISVRILGFR